MKKGFRLHYSWLICFACTLVMFTSQGLSSSSFSIHFPYMVKIADLMQAQASMISTVRHLFTLLGLFVINALMDRIGVRKTLMLATLLGALGFFLYGRASTFTGYCVCSAILGLNYAFGGEVPLSVMIVRWFNSRRGLALGLSSLGSGIALILMPPIVAGIADRNSLRAAFTMEAVLCMLAFLIGTVVIMRNFPKEKEVEPYSEGEETAAVTKGGDRTEKASVITAIMCACALFGIACNGIVGNFSLHYTFAGFDSATIPMLISAYGISLAVGKVVLGYISDKIGTYKTVIIFGILLTVGGVFCASLVLTHSTFLGIVGALLLGFGYPMGNIGLSIYANDMASKEDYARILKRFKMTYTIGALVFSPLPGIACDYYGDYGIAYAIMHGMNIVAILILLITYRRLGKTGRNAV